VLLAIAIVMVLLAVVEVEVDVEDDVDVEKERRIGEEEEGVDDWGGGVNEVVGWLTKEKLEHPFEFRSAYGVEEDGEKGNDRELLPFTNVTSDFVGTLDYVFYERSKFEQLERLDVPTTFRMLNPKGETNGHLLPSNIWPSDHLVIGATFGVIPQHSKSSSTCSESQEDEEEVVAVDNNEKGDDFNGFALLQKLHSSDQPIASAFVPTNIPDQPIASANVTPNLPDQSIPSAYVPSSIPNQPIASVFVSSHNAMPNCACGCVPNILSLFQMAELRKQAKLKAQQASKS